MNLERYLSVLDNKDVNYVEIHPIIALDNDMNPTSYDNAKGFEQCEEDDPNIVAYGVYLHIQGQGLECMFDVVDREQAELAQAVLMRLLKLN
jgi:hypothetical protein